MPSSGPTSRTSTGRSTSSSTPRSEEHTSELQSRLHLVCRLLLEKKKKPVDAKCAPLKTTSYLADGFKGTQYEPKKPAMTLASKVLGAKERTNPPKTTLPLRTIHL